MPANAPWENVSMSFNYNTELPTKHTASEEELPCKVMASIDHTSSTLFYTDGGVKDGRAAAEVVHNELSATDYSQQSLHNGVSTTESPPLSDLTMEPPSCRQNL